MLFRPAVIGLFAVMFSHSGLAGATAPVLDPIDVSQGSVSSPLPPEYLINADGSVTLRICFDWSCASRQTMTFSTQEMYALKRLMATCSDTALHDRLQRVRIGIWHLELLAEKYQPLLANDQAINDFEESAHGRMDCVDNSSNTTTYLHVLQDIGELTGWTVTSPSVRNRFDINGVHWTAVIIDSETDLSWSVDSWFRPNGHLPMVMPLRDWIDEHKGWEPPFERLNATPHSIQELCATQPELETLSLR